MLTATNRLQLQVATEKLFSHKKITIPPMECAHKGDVTFNYWKSIRLVFLFFSWDKISY